MAAQESMAESARQSITLSWWQFGIGFVALFFVGLTLYYTRQTAKAAIGATNAAVEAAAAARASVETSERIAETQLRAQVIVLIPTVETPVAGRPVKINFSVKNAGQTPAHEASVFASVEYRDFVNQQPFADPVELSPGFRSELVQDSEIPIVVRTREPCPDDFPAKIASKTSGIFILVEVRYIDDFKKPGIRESRFMYDWRNLREGSNRMFTAVQVGQAPER